MRNASESIPSSRSGRFLFLAAVFVSAFLTIMVAQKAANPPKYDPQSEAKMKGTVDEVKFPPKGSEKDAAHLMVKNGADLVDIYLCPKSFLDDMGVTFSKGDEIALTGSKIKAEGADLVLAREVIKGNDTVVLRDEKGNPVWDWHR
ncbi:MAG: hypothetical protein JWO91_104 [Acidobacteriaceae bacterium]|jgi:hypothetical protein|nr:hypothetical protein [Acidobacteriaceae bacterium]